MILEGKNMCSVPWHTSLSTWGKKYVPGTYRFRVKFMSVYIGTILLLLGDYSMVTRAVHTGTYSVHWHTGHGIMYSVHSTTGHESRWRHHNRRSDSESESRHDRIFESLALSDLRCRRCTTSGVAPTASYHHDVVGHWHGATTRTRMSVMMTYDVVRRSHGYYTPLLG